MAKFSVWLTTFVKQYEQDVTMLLINTGFTVSALDDKNILTSGSNGKFTNYIIALSAETNEKITREVLHNKIKDFLKDNKKSYYSLITIDDENHSKMWCAGEIFLPENTNKSLGSPFRDSPKE